MKKICLFKSTMKNNKAILAELREAGFVPLMVESFDDFRVIDPSAPDHNSVVWETAMEAIEKSGTPETDHIDARSLFGYLLAKKLQDMGRG